MQHHMFCRFSAALLAGLSVFLLCAPAVPAADTPAAPALADSGMDYTESTETLLNPGMGYTSTLWYRLAPDKINIQNPTGSLVLMFVDIGAYSSGENGTKDADGKITGGKDYPFDEAFFTSLRGTFENCRKNGCTIALRFRYDDDGTQNPEPATFDMLKSHIRQIDESGLLRDYQDILMYVESGFVGCYGEQWGGKYCSLEQKAELLEMMLDVVPDPIPVTVRTPNIFAKWAGIEQKDLGDWVSEPGSRAARVGLYDDGYMGSDSDLGTYSNREKETAWLGNQTLTSYFGGEFSGNLEFAQKYDTYLPENAVPEMYKTHLSYINSNIFALYNDYTFGEKYDVEHVDNSAYYGQTVRKFIRDHLGYRFVIRDCRLTPEAEAGDTIQVQFSVENTGFANPVREQKAELLLEKDGNYMRTGITLDSRTWRSCTVTDVMQSVQLPGGLEAGKWNLYLKLSVGENTVPQTSLRSVRFANSGIWNAGLGANLLGSITVQEAGSPEKQAVRSFGSDGDGAVYTINGLQITDGAVSHAGELGTPCAESETGKLYLHNDLDYVYLTAQYDAKADAEVHNIRFKNETNGETYWIYFASNGYIYFNHGDASGCIRRCSDGIVEFRFPMGEVMGLYPDTELSSIRYFLQDSANEWALLSDVTRTDPIRLDGSFPVYSAARTVWLHAGNTLPLTVTDGAGECTYQWQHNGKAIAGADSAAYTVSADGSEAAGTYSVIIQTKKEPVQTKEVVIAEVGMLSGAALAGDVNTDGKADTADVILLQKYLLTEQKTLPAWKNADLNADGKLTSADLTLLKGIAAR